MKVLQLSEPIKAGEDKFYLMDSPKQEEAALRAAFALLDSEKVNSFRYADDEYGPFPCKNCEHRHEKVGACQNKFCSCPKNKPDKEDDFLRREQRIDMYLLKKAREGNLDSIRNLFKRSVGAIHSYFIDIQVLDPLTLIKPETKT